MSAHAYRLCPLITVLACACTFSGLGACDSSSLPPKAQAVTRAQVEADLKRAEDRGYRPVSDPPDNPNDIQNAEKGPNGPVPATRQGLDR
jgi:hypothetical protein